MYQHTPIAAPSFCLGCICKLTVAAGTINGLVFYANIVTVNRAISFPPNQTNILAVFISLVNLDLGFEACFFDGMDEYSKTWLQFIFPLYVWSSIVLIVIASEYSSRISCKAVWPQPSCSSGDPLSSFLWKAPACSHHCNVFHHPRLF